MKFSYINPVLATVVLVLINSACFCQQKEIEITKFYQKTVPQGKVWYISNDQSYPIRFSNGVFESGTACNAAIKSNPSYIYGIVSYEKFNDTHQPIILGFTMKDSPRWLHDDVYEVKPYFMLKGELNSNLLTQSLSWIYRHDEIVFYPGTKLQTSSCIDNLILHERAFNKRDQKDLLAKEAEKVAQEKEYQLQVLKYNYLNEMQMLDKYKNKESTYALNELVNSGKLFSNSRTDSLCNFVGNCIKKNAQGDIEKYERQLFPYQSTLDIKIHVKWDSLGKVISCHTSGNVVVDTSLLSNLLSFQISPIINFQKSIRKCCVEDDVHLLANYVIESKSVYEVKSKKNGIKFLKKIDVENEERIKSILNTHVLGNGRYYKLILSKVLISLKYVPFKDNYDAVTINTVEDNCLSVEQENIF